MRKRLGLNLSTAGQKLCLWDKQQKTWKWGVGKQLITIGYKIYGHS